MKIAKYVLMAFFLASGLHAFAAGGDALAIQVTQGWIRWLPGGLPVAGYLTIGNTGDQPVDLVGESSLEYETVMLHRTMDRNGAEHMEMVDRLTIPAHGKVVISPGKYHFMMMNGRHPIKPGDAVRMTLRFSDGEIVHARLKVRPASGAN